MVIPAGAGVDGVLDQFLDRRRRPFHDLASRDPVDGGIVKLSDDRAHVGAEAVHSTKPSRHTAILKRGKARAYRVSTPHGTKVLIGVFETYYYLERRTFFRTLRTH